MLARQSADRLPELHFEMAFARALAEQKVRGHEETTNEHLVKLLAFDVPEPTRAIWKKEIRKHFRYLGAIRLKPKAALIPQSSWLAWMYEDPFQGNELGYTDGLISLNADEYRRNDKLTIEIAADIRLFYAGASVALSLGEPVEQFIPV